MLRSVRFLLCAGLLLAGQAPAFAGALERFVFERAEMGLPFRITLYAGSPDEARAAADAAFQRIAELNATLSDYDSDSELSRLSRTSGSGKAVPVGGDLWRVMERAQSLAQQTDGAFDITVGPYVSLWRRARRTKELPAPGVLAELRSRVGFQNVRLDPAACTAELLAPEMRLDAGGIAKGYAVDEALAVLKRHGITRALVGGGGDMAAGEAPPGEQGWRVEVAPLDVPSAPASEMVLLRHSAIATSGDVFQRVEIEGRRYSHIVDPRTGLGLTDHALVTIVAPDCLTADSVATAVSVLGPARGVEFIETLPGVAAHCVRKPGEQTEVLQSARWREVPKLTEQP